MVTKTQDIQAKLQALTDAYVAQLPEKLKDISLLWQNIVVDRDRVSDDFNTVHRLVHSLVGSGATFGLHQLSDKAREIEQLIKHWGKDKISVTNDEWDKVSQLINRFCMLEARSGSAVIDKPAPTETTLKDNEEMGALIYILEDDIEADKKVSLQLTRFGYQVEQYSTGNELINALKERLPAAIISNIVLAEGNLAGIDIVQRIHEHHAPNLPVIFTSSLDEFAVRLEAVRAGGDAYFIKPINIDQLADRLDKLTAPDIQDPYRILIVDDDVILADYYALILTKEGMEVSIMSQPKNIFQDIAKHDPEMILMDIHMPECSGLELAKLIRLQDNYLTIPIVFLSTENKLENQLTALGLGGDDFLNKPIGDEHLVLSVTARVQRARQLSGLMSKDSLTGLLKHAHIKQQLMTELSRAKRQKSVVSFIMIDIDHFKQVNDNYGHMMGDRVLKNLARLLQQRLRKTDSIGRYGGEEFALVLPDTDIDNALLVVNEIRQQFSEMRFTHENSEFSVTFSAGLSGFPMYNAAEKINQTADEALYKAKHQGRNCVAISKMVK